MARKVSWKPAVTEARRTRPRCAGAISDCTARPGRGNPARADQGGGRWAEITTPQQRRQVDRQPEDGEVVAPQISRRQGREIPGVANGAQRTTCRLNEQSVIGGDD